MLEIKTNFGTFGNPQDLLRFMKEEKLESITVSVSYIFDPVCKECMTLKQVAEWANKSLQEGV